jgi:hypothetical protein
MTTPKLMFQFHLPTEQPEGEPETVLAVHETEAEALAQIVAEVGPGDWRVFRQGEVTNSEAESGIHHVGTAPKRSPMKSANDLYAMEPIRTSLDPWHFHRTLPELEHDRIPETDDVSANTRVEARYLSDPYIDGYRVSELYTLWLDDKPFAVCQEAGRSGKDHQARFLTDAKVFGEAMAYLVSLYEYEAEESPEIIDPNTPMRALTTFYGDDAFTE